MDPLSALILPSLRPVFAHNNLNFRCTLDVKNVHCVGFTAFFLGIAAEDCAVAKAVYDQFIEEQKKGQWRRKGFS